MNKEEIINNYDKGQFSDFLSMDNDGKIIELLDDEGLEILNNSELKSDRIRYILTYSKYKNELFRKSEFLDVFFNNDIEDFYASLNHLEESTYDYLLNYAINKGLDINIITLLFCYFNESYRINCFDRFNLSEELIYSIFKYDTFPVCLKIMNKYNIDLTKHDIDLRTFFYNAKEYSLKMQANRNTGEEYNQVLTVPPRMINKSVAKKLWETYDVYLVRAIINDANYCCNVMELNDYVKKQEEDIIVNCDNNTLVPPFDVLFDLYCKYKELESKNMENGESYDEYYEAQHNLIEFVREYYNMESFFEISKNYDESIEEFYNNVKTLSDNMISNYIIDYHFEENYHNIMIDVRELLRFYYDGYIDLPEEKVDLYFKISNIDYFSVQEKLEIHEMLKDYNMMEVFYDDMAMARNVVTSAIKDYSLTQQELAQYKDEKKSKEMGVDIYVIDNEPFFGIVKTGIPMEDNLPTGHSYSLVGTGGLAVFGDIKASSTFFYDSDDLNPEQVVHVFPFDSYTYYHPFEHSVTASSRVKTLLMPDRLVQMTPSYNEILLLERGKTSTDIDKRIPKLRKMALYCLDEIRQQDIESAKANGVGIVLVKSSDFKYDESEITNDDKRIEYFDYNYFNGSYEKEKFEANR